MQVTENFIQESLKEKIKIEYHKKVFVDGQQIKPEWMVDPQKPESLIDQVFLNIMEIIGIPQNLIVAQNRVKLFDLFKDKKYRYPDYKLIKHRKSEKNLLIELEPYNSDKTIGVKQAKEWIQEISIGSYNNALAINLNSFILIYFDGESIKEKELSLEETIEYIKNIIYGERLSIDLEDINKITQQFYNQFYAIIHGGVYTSTQDERITITEENSIFNNLNFAERLRNEQKIEFIYTVFNRLIFIKILIDWNLFPKVFPYLRNVPKHLIQADLNNLFFKTLAVKKENRVNLPDAYIDIPFLNGGLFRMTQIERENPDLMIKPRYIISIFDFLEEFTFLDNGDKRASINSEILGYIFEKTIEFRKGTGSYYTHNIICDFMCEKTLYPHILKRINIFLTARDYKKDELLENFEEIFMLREKSLLEIYNKIIKNIRVCDICVGSGAFLLSMGHLLFDIHKRILNILNQSFNETDIKQYIVEHNLFGVDLVLSAIQICQLRLWLWISEASEELQPLPNIEYNLRVGNTLLGSNKRIDITTVNYQFINKIKGAEFLDLNDPRIKPIIKEIESGVISFDALRELKTILLNLYIYSHDTNTILLKDLIESLNKLIIVDADRIYLDYLKNKIKKQNLRDKLNLDFLRRMKAFHWYLEFPQVFPNGFDVIVGNPPYISAKFMEKIFIEQDIQTFIKKVNKKEKRIKTLKSEKTISEYKSKIKEINKKISKLNVLLETKYYQEEKIYNSIYKEYIRNEYMWAYKIYDILVPFFERGFNLLRNNQRSYLSFITSNKFLATDYGQKIRKDLLNNFRIELLVDISMIKVFKDAAVYPIIITVNKNTPEEKSQINIGRYKDINNLGLSLYEIEQQRYNKEDINYLIYIPLKINSFILFDKLYNHSNCSTINDEFEDFYRPFHFTKWGDYEVFISEKKGNKIGEDYYQYITNNDIKPFQIIKEKFNYFHKNILQSKNPKNLTIEEDKWSLFSVELLMIKEVALDLICVLTKDYVNIGKIYNLFLKEDSELTNLSNHYFQALFNSRLLDFYFRVVFWNTHLSGGYLNYHFSYLKILPILNIDLNKSVYSYIVFLSKCLNFYYDEGIRDLLEILILCAYFPTEIALDDSIEDFLNNLLDEEINEQKINEIQKGIEKTNAIINSLKNHDYYKILIAERKFKE